MSHDTNTMGNPHGNIYKFTVGAAEKMDVAANVSAAAVESMLVCAWEHIKAGNHGRKACYQMSLTLRTQQPEMSGSDRRKLVTKAYHLAMVEYHTVLIG